MRLIDADALKERIRRFLGIRSLDDLFPEEKAIVQHIDRMPSADAIPCNFCRFSPPSLEDGKPCGVCPAERREG